MNNDHNEILTLAVHAPLITKSQLAPYKVQLGRHHSIKTI